MSLAACTLSSKPYSVSEYSGNSLASQRGDTPSEACREFAVAVGSSYKGATQFNCAVASVPGEVFPIVKVCEPLVQSPFSMSVEDGALLSMLIISVWVSAAIFRWLARAVSDKGDKDD